jgi:FlaA1/EpsC-like NDP-sugar epimerase
MPGLHQPLAIAFQLVLVVISNRLAFLLRFDGVVPPLANEAFWHGLLWLVPIRALTFVPFKLYEGLWRYTSLYDLRALVGGVSCSSGAFFLLTLTPFGVSSYPHSIVVVDAVLLLLLLGGVRISRRVLAETPQGEGKKRILIFGAGDAGELIAREIRYGGGSGYQPVGFVDDDQGKVGHRIHGVKVLGTRKDLPHILNRYRPHEVLLAIPRAEPIVIRSVVRSLEAYKIPIKTLPNLRDLMDGKAELSQIRSLSVEDLLTRAPVGLNPGPLKYLIGGRRVMVTGAGGSIGTELCRQIAALKPASLVMFERYENALHAIRTDLEDVRGPFGLYPVLGDVTDPVRVREVIQQYQPEIVFHTAAHKHVPLMEENPCEAIKNNVRGTRLLCEAAEQYGVDRFVLISTDKAVNPTGVMGASKRLAELVVRSRANGGFTSFCIVRFGNVLASNGSVVPRFIEQIKKGGPVTITHPEIRRFFMLIQEAVQLVLHAAAQAESGATYVLEMGEQVKLIDMARHLIRLSGFVPEDEIPIEFVGLRPGEKLYEELVGRDEDVSRSAVDKIMRVTSRDALGDLSSAIAQIESDAAAGRREAVLLALQGLTGLSTDAPPPVSTAAEAVPSRASDSTIASSIEQPCPKCESSRLRRSRPRSLPEGIRRRFSTRRLFRCSDCGWRGWLIPLQFYDAGAIEGVPTPLDFTSLDVAMQKQRTPPGWTPRNVH